MPPTAMRSANPPPRWKPQAKQHFAAGNFQTTSLLQPPHGGRRFSGAAGIRQPTPGWRAPTCWRAASRPPNTRDCCAITRRSPKPRKDSVSWRFASRPHGRGAAAFFRIRHRGRQHQRALLHRVRQAGARQRQGRPGPAQSGGHQSQARRAVRPDGRSATPIRASRLMHWKAATERNPRNTVLLEGARRTATWPTTITPRPPRPGAAANRPPPIPPSASGCTRRACSIEQQRLDYEAAEKQRRGRRGGARPGEAEGRGTRRSPRARSQSTTTERPAKADSKAVPWWDGPKPGGKVERHAETGGLPAASRRASVVRGRGHKTVKLLIPDPGQDRALAAGGEQSLGCGVQKPRRVIIEYFPKANARLATAGEVATIEFQ